MPIILADSKGRVIPNEEWGWQKLDEWDGKALACMIGDMLNMRGLDLAGYKKRGQTVGDSHITHVRSRSRGVGFVLYDSECPGEETAGITQRADIASRLGVKPAKVSDPRFSIQMFYYEAGR